MPTVVRSHAKINLGLHIGAPRSDGFHGLATVYQTLALYDLVTVSARPAATTTVRLTSNDSRVPTDSSNTAWKMVELALAPLGKTAEVEIHIEKRLPVQGGMGAGSANAVAALVGLETELGIGNGLHRLPPIEQTALDGWGARLQTEPEIGEEPIGLPGLKGETWGTQGSGFGDADPSTAREAKNAARSAQDDRPIGEIRRLEIAAQVGSDVPLFLIGGTVLGVDRGQQVYPLPDIEPTWCVVAIPYIAVSTAQAFRDWDTLCAAEGLTPEASTAKLNRLSRAYASAFAGGFPEGRPGAGSSGVLSNGENLAGPQESALVRTGISSWIQNDFERVVFPQHPSLAEIKRILAAPGTPEAALHASLSGSGSALYGLYRSRGDAEAAQARLESQFQDTGPDRGLRSILTRTLPRERYWNEMLMQEGD